MPFTSALAVDLAGLLDASWTATAVFSKPAQRERPIQGTEILVGSHAVERAMSAWDHIEQAGGTATAFQKLASARHLAYAHLRQSHTPRIIVVHEAGEPAVILPTVVTRWHGLATIRFLGDPLIQYGDAIALPGAAQASIEAAWRAAADPAAGQLIYLRKVRSDARIAPVLERTARTAATHEAPFIDAARGPSLSARDARELRRFRRRLLELGDVRFEVLQGATAAAAVNEALAIKRVWIDEHGLPSNVIGNDEWESAISALAEEHSSPLRVARLSVGERTAAVEVAFVHDDRWCAFLGALSPDFARHGPGHIQMTDTVAHCRDAGISLYDLLAPAETYKTRIAHGSATVRDYVAPLTAAGWAGAAIAHGIPAIKTIAARMPPGLRRVLLTARRGGSA